MEDQFISASQLENMAEVFGDCATGFVFVYYPLEDVMYVSKNAMASWLPNCSTAVKGKLFLLLR